MNIVFPEQFLPLFDRTKRHLGAHGGRGGAKSWSFADVLLELGRQIKIRVLCAREIHLTIKDSVHKLLSNKIEEHKYYDYIVDKTSIVNSVTGTDFFFMGLYRNKNNIKSIEGVDICWVEEAHAVSMESLDYLVPTIRKSGSQIWYSFNRFAENDPVWEKIFKHMSARTILIEVNIDDLNPEFQSQELLEEKEHDRIYNPEKYEHIWLGKPKGRLKGLIYPEMKTIPFQDIPLHLTRTIYGLDFGWNVPSALLKIEELDRKLYVTEKLYQTHLTNNDIIEKLKILVPDRRCLIYCDNEPDRIEEINRAGFNALPFYKVPGSVEDGIGFINSIWGCIYSVDSNKFLPLEAQKYRWMQNKEGEKESDSRDEPVKEFDHLLDALRGAGYTHYKDSWHIYGRKTRSRVKKKKRLNP